MATSGGRGGRSRKSAGKKWSAADYRHALLGDGMPGLRSVGKGFAASDGYNLSNIASWTRSQKKRVQSTYWRMYGLFAQERRIVRPRTKESLRTLQESFHGDVPSGNFRVAFVPYTAPGALHAKKGAKPAPLRVRIQKSRIVFDNGVYRKYYERFDKLKLAADTDREMQRIFDGMPGASYFFVRVGQFQTLGGKSAGLLVKQVKELMSKYDGKKPIPRGSGNYGDRPQAHKWDKWLEGVDGYAFMKRADPVSLQRQIVEGMQASKELRQDQPKALRRDDKTLPARRHRKKAGKKQHRRKQGE